MKSNDSFLKGYGGFNYRLKDEILARQKLQSIFNRLSENYNSTPIELPLVAPTWCFIGKTPKPLNERQSHKLLIGHLPDGNSVAVRYEGTSLTAQMVAANILNNSSILNARYHYFQEMVRLEYNHELDDKHLRSFYQAGLEMFALTKEEHSRNKIELIEVMSKFLSKINKDYCIRISHVGIIKSLLEPMKIKDYDKRRIIGFLEKYQAEELFKLLQKLQLPKTIGKILLEMAHLSACKMNEGIKLLEKYPEYFNQVQADLNYIQENLNEKVLANCKFDGGIHRSLDFYSGIVFQCDIGSMVECIGGGEFTGLVEAYGVHDKNVYSIGMAAGVERLLQV